MSNPDAQLGRSLVRLGVGLIILGACLVAPGDAIRTAATPEQRQANASIGTFNVRDYGAKGDRTADDTAAIQAAIDAATGPDPPATSARDARGEVYLPAGIYRVSKPLRIWSVSNLTFRGDGGSSRLLPTGAMASVLDINGAAYSSFRSFQVMGTLEEEVENAIYFYWDPAGAARSASRCEFRDISVRGTRCVTGLRVGKPGSGNQVDTSSYVNLTMAGDWKPGETRWYQGGFYVGDGAWGNNLIHTFLNASSTEWRHGFDVSTTSMSLTGGSLGYNDVDFRVDTGSYFLVQGVRSEWSGRLLTSESSTNQTSHYTLSDVTWTSPNLPEDKSIIKCYMNGCLILRNVYMYTHKDAGDHQVIVMPSRGCSLIVQGATSTSSLDRFLAGCGPSVQPDVLGFATVDDRGFVSMASRSSRPVAPAPATLRAKDLALTGSIDFGDGRKWTNEGLFVDGTRSWTADGLKPGGPIKWPGSGTLTDGPLDSLRWIGWTVQPDGTRRTDWLVPMRAR